MDAHEKSRMLFTQLVFMLHAAAMHQMGKLKNPLTDKIERDLGAAQSTIDMLDMIREKTRGNLHPDEERLINDLLRELKLNYVDESGKPDESSGKKENT